MVHETDQIKISYVVTFDDRPVAVVYSVTIADDLISEGHVTKIVRNEQLWYGSWEAGTRAYTIISSQLWYQRCESGILDEIGELLRPMSN